MVRKKSIPREFPLNSECDDLVLKRLARCDLAIAISRASACNVTSCHMPQSRSRLDVCTIVRVAGDMVQFALSMLRPRGLSSANISLTRLLRCA